MYETRLCMVPASIYISVYAIDIPIYDLLARPRGDTLTRPTTMHVQSAFLFPTPVQSTLARVSLSFALSFESRYIREGGYAPILVCTPGSHTWSSNKEKRKGENKK